MPNECLKIIESKSIGNQKKNPGIPYLHLIYFPKENALDLPFL